LIVCDFKVADDVVKGGQIIVSAQFSSADMVDTYCFLSKGLFSSSVVCIT
jgi:hypothetical protein